jgi:ADP-heptose:LPS heptosyltransferase
MPKFLIVRFSSIGDIVLTTPVVRCLKQQVAGAEVHYLTKKNFAPVIEHNPFIDKKIYLEGALTELIPELKKVKYDFVIDLHHNLRSLYLKAQLGAKYFSFNKINFQKWLMVNFKVDRLLRVHIVDRYMETLKSFGVINDGKGLEYYISQEDGQAVQKLPVNFREKYIAFVIGAKHNTKQLPKEKILSICQKLNRPVVFLGGNEDYEKGEWLIQEVVSKQQQSAAVPTATATATIFNACGKFSLNESAAIIKHADWIITHDTGLMHIAAAFKKKIVSVWGNTIPEFGMYPYYGDFQIENLISEVKNLSCRPCTKLGFEKCPKGHFKCMMDIDEGKILEIIR